jgi:hypothetical protein
MKLSSSSDDMLSRLLNVTLDTWVGLGKTLQSLDKLWKVRWVLWLDGDTHDWGDRELHDLDVVGSLGGGDGSRLDQELINSDKSNGVSTWAILNWVDGSSHHENGTLDLLNEEIILLSWKVVWSHNSDLLSGLDDSGEDTSEGVETSLIGGWHHLGDIHHEWSLWVTVSDGSSALIVHWSLVEILYTVSLGNDWGWEMEDNHVQKGIGGWEELSHDDLHEGLSVAFLLLRGEVNLEGDEHLLVGVLLVIHDGLEELEDWVQNELAESTLKGLSGWRLVALEPLLGFWVEEMISPESLHKLLLWNSELGGVQSGESVKGEGPSVKSGSEGDSSL